MNRMMLSSAVIGAAVLGAAIVGGCQTAPKTAAERDTLASDVQAALTAFRNADASLDGLLARSVGYAVFPDIGKAGLIAGGAYGRGELFEGGVRVGFCDVRQGTVGLQAGAQTYSQIIIFLTPEKLQDFKSGKLAFAANASAVAIKAGAAATADYSGGVVVFVQSRGGLMAEAAIGGQQFTFSPF